MYIVYSVSLQVKSVSFRTFPIYFALLLKVYVYGCCSGWVLWLLGGVAAGAIIAVLCTVSISAMALLLLYVRCFCSCLVLYMFLSTGMY